MDQKNVCEAVIIGAAIVDLPLCPVSKEVFDVPSYPVDSISMTVGGDAINEATILTRLGHKVALAGCVGNDIPGNFVLEHCSRNGIDTSYMKIDEQKVTSINVGLVTADGERTFITSRGGSLWKFCIEDIDLSVLKKAKILSFASIFNNPLFDGSILERLFSEAKRQGMVIFADMVAPRLQETLEDIRGALSYVDYFFPNYDEASQMARETDIDRIANCFLECGVKHILLKIGKKGCLAKSAKERYLVPAYPDSNCIDTIGAGDNFAAGFISAFLEGKNFESCAQFANAVASLSVEAAGATEGVQSRSQAEERYRRYLELEKIKKCTKI